MTMNKLSHSTIPAALGAEVSALAQTFPTLRGVEGVSPFNADALARRWAGAGEESKAPDVLARDHAITFLLGPVLRAIASRMPHPEAITLSGEAQRVAREWDPEVAFRFWDRPHREAFVGWVMSLPYAFGSFNPVPPNPGFNPVPPNPGETEDA
jgi:hypothetical protein